MMGVVINPGSENKGGTVEQALLNAQEWLKIVHANGFKSVELIEIPEFNDGLWDFTLNHSVTGKTVKLSVHGLSDAECEKFMFRPREYWNGCSSSEPCIEDWLPEGWTYEITYSKD